MLTRRAVLSGFCAALALVRHGGAQPQLHYSLGPWQWHDTHWAPPASCIGLVDLRTLPQCGTAGGRPGQGVFATTKPLGAGYTLLNDQRTALLGHLLHGDPAGRARCKPLMPTHGNRLSIMLAGAVLLDEPFVLGSHPHTGLVRDVYQHDVEEYWRQIESGHMGLEALQRIVGYWVLQHGASWHAFVPRRLWREFPGTLAPATTIRDTFNRADSATLGTSSDGDWSWFEDTDWPNLRIITNRVEGTNITYGRARAEKDLSSANHYTQASLSASSLEADYAGVLVRRHPVNIRYYTFQCNPDDDDTALYKVVDTVATLLASGTGGVLGSPITTRLTVNGSTLTAQEGSTVLHTVTDTALTASVRTGIEANAASASQNRIEDFEAADIVPVHNTGRYFMGR